MSTMTGIPATIITAVTMALTLTSCDKSDGARQESDVFFGAATVQKSISRVNMMQDMPGTYHMIDWEKTARDYDAYVFDWNRTSGPGPLIWMDISGKKPGFGLYTTVGDVRQGPKRPSSHESINTIAAVLSGGLMGIDKTNQDGFNYPEMLQNYFADANGWKIMLNNTSGYATDWWYNVLPNILYYGVCDIFPDVNGAKDIQKSIADQFVAADKALGDSYDYSYFDYGTMRGVSTHIPHQQDAAGGHGYVLLCAYEKFGDAEYLERAKHAIKVLDSQRESRFYEILLPFGIYTAAKLNAEESTDYDIHKMLGWLFNGSAGRSGWGVITGTWGPYSVDGLQGSTTDGGGYAFLMNSFEMAWPLVPMVKYQPQYAAAIGKWMLNNASASRLFYPGYIDDAHQFAPELKNLTANNVAYEGLRFSDRYRQKDACPIAEGDGPSWTSTNPTSSMFSLYSTSPVGVFGSMIKKTDVEGILRLDCNVTDFYAERTYPVYLYYNPYDVEKTVTYQTSEKADIFDIISKTFLSKGIAGKGQIPIPPKGAVVVYELPVGTILKYDDGKIIADGKYTILN